MKALLTLLCVLAVAGCSSFSSLIQARLEQPGLEGTRWGLVVLTMDGRELVSVNPDQRFLPASNTKLFTAAAAFFAMDDMSRPDPARGTSVLLSPRAYGPPDIILRGAGDPVLSDAPDCVRDCLQELADMVSANGLKRIGRVIADASLLPHEPWPPGWSQDDLVTRSGAPVSALSLNSNELRLTIRPGPGPGLPASIDWAGGEAAGVIRNDILTRAGDEEPMDIRAERTPGSGELRLYGEIRLDSLPIERIVAVDEPALVAGRRFEQLLAERGVAAELPAVQRLRPFSDTGEDARNAGLRAVEIGRLVAPPLAENVTFLMKESQNLHSELLLRRIGLVSGDGSRQAGLAVVAAMLSEAGVPRWAWDLSDGSGMSVYNRLTPRMTAQFLLWTANQSWGEAFRTALPVGGVDGTLQRRFAGTPLAGRIFAKTGTLRGTNGLSGFMLTRGGEMLVFSAFANERPSKAPSATARIDAALLAIAENS